MKAVAGNVGRARRFPRHDNAVAQGVPARADHALLGVVPSAPTA